MRNAFVYGIVCLFTFVSTAFAQCPAGTPVVYTGPGNKSYNLNSGEVLYINGNTGSGTITIANNNGASICVASNIVANLNNIKLNGNNTLYVGSGATLTVNGTGQGTFNGSNNNIVISAGATLVIAGNTFTNGAYNITNNGTIRFTGNSPAMGGAGSNTFVNNGLFEHTGTGTFKFDHVPLLTNNANMIFRENLENSEMQQFINEGNVTVGKHFYNHGSFTNNALLELPCNGPGTGYCGMTVGDKGSLNFTNNQCLKITGFLSISGNTINNKLILITPDPSPTGKAYGGATAQTGNGNLTINKAITGTGRFVVENGYSFMGTEGRFALNASNMSTIGFCDKNTPGNKFDVNNSNTTKNDKITVDCSTATCGSCTALNYYYLGSGSVNDVNNWGANTNGSGGHPVDFTNPLHIFNIANTAAATLTGNWTVIGKIDLQNATLSVPAGTSLTAGVINRSGTSGQLSVTPTTNLVITGINTSCPDIAACSKLYFNPSANELRDLTINACTSLETALYISPGYSSCAQGTVTVAGSGVAFTTNGLLTLGSGAFGTANIAPNTTSSNYISGDVTVERYIPENATRAWRLLSVPTKGSQTIYQSWQEGGSLTANYGTLITNPAANWSANGFDAKTPGHSMTTYNATSNTFTGISSTNTPIETTTGYMLYLRGDRTVNPAATNQNPGATTLRTKGSLYQGSQPTINVAQGTSQMIGNVYPSAINLKELQWTGGLTNAYIYVWDPKLIGNNGLGAYQVLMKNSNGDYVTTIACGTPETVTGGSYGTIGTVVNTIQSGQAFFVHAADAPGSLTFTEAAKVEDCSSSTLFSATTLGRYLSSTLSIKKGTDLKIADGTLHLFDESFTNAVTAGDAKKMYNQAINFYLSSSKKALAVEERTMPTESDTLYFKSYGLKQQQYQLSFDAQTGIISGITAWLEDSYTGKSTLINLNGVTIVDFEVNKDEASAGTDRFRIVFHKEQLLPLTFTSIKASAERTGNKVTWSVAGQEDLQAYTVEKSDDGVVFAKTADINPRAGSTQSYEWLDETATATSYYRVIGNKTSGEKIYSAVVSVVSSAKNAMHIYPNPAEGGRFYISSEGTVKGKETVRIITFTGVEVFKQTIEVRAGTSTRQVNVGKQVSTGQYIVEVTAPDKTKTIQRIFITNF